MKKKLIMFDINRNIKKIFVLYILILFVEFFHFVSNLNIIIMLESLICLVYFVLQNIFVLCVSIIIKIIEESEISNNNEIEEIKFPKNLD